MISSKRKIAASVLILSSATMYAASPVQAGELRPKTANCEFENVVFGHYLMHVDRNQSPEMEVGQYSSQNNRARFDLYKINDYSTYIIIDQATEHCLQYHEDHEQFLISTDCEHTERLGATGWHITKDGNGASYHISPLTNSGLTLRPRMQSTNGSPQTVELGPIDFNTTYDNWFVHCPGF